MGSILLNKFEAREEGITLTSKVPKFIEFNNREYNYAHLTVRFEHESQIWYHDQLKFFERFSHNHDGYLPHTLFVAYLEARRDINIPRFDKNHPVLGQLIAGIPSVPEPTSGLLLGLGLILSILIRKIL